MGSTTEPLRRVRACHQPGMWVISLDDASWAELMVALGVAIEHSDLDWAARWRHLRTALSTAEVETDSEREKGGVRPVFC